MRAMLVFLMQCALAQQIQLPRTLPQLQGRILVATSKSRDRDLGQSVVLVIHSGADGIMGLVVNRPAAGTKPPTWFGGPIALGVRELFRSTAPAKDAECIFADVYLTRKIDDRPGARVYAGYAGWSVPQWQNEMDNGLWRVIPAEARMVFDPHPETLWRRISVQQP
jgi:putative transcriptional regulator